MLSFHDFFEFNFFTETSSIMQDIGNQCIVYLKAKSKSIYYLKPFIPLIYAKTIRHFP